MSQTSPPSELPAPGGKTPPQTRRAPASDDQKRKAIRGPLFSCAIQGCAEEFSWPPDDLFWCEPPDDLGPGWFCTNCIEYEDRPLGEPGESLERFLARHET